jgi:hypothetical protein
LESRKILSQPGFEPWIVQPVAYALVTTEGIKHVLTDAYKVHSLALIFTLSYSVGMGGLFKYLWIFQLYM